MVIDKRISWNKYFIEITKLVSQRSTCTKRRTGAIIVKDNKIIGTGYGGSPKGMEHCDDAGCLIVDNHCIRTIHAEQNALLQCKQDIEDTTIYCTCLPCSTCFKLLIQSGVKKIVYLEDRRKDDIQYWLDSGRIEVVKYNE